MTTHPGRALLADDPVLAAHLDAARHEHQLLDPGLQVTAMLRHLPGRRAALLAERESTPLVVKVFSSPRARGNHRRLEAMGRAGLAAITPASLGVAANGHVGVLTYTPGQVLDIVDDDQFLVGASGAGLALARLHQSGTELDRSWTWQDEVDQLVRRAPASLLPVAWGAQHRPLRTGPLVPSHRDFHPRQIVLTLDHTVRLIDLDDAAMAPAGLDVGNMVAHLRREALVHGRASCLVETAVRAFLSAYGATPAGLEQWVQLALIRLAGLAETRHHDLPQRDALLTMAGPTLTAPEPRTITVVTGHTDRPVRIEERPGAAPVVLKEYRAGAGSEVHEVMEQLWASPFGAGRSPRPGMPRPLAFSAQRHTLTMEFLPGEPVATRGDLGSSLVVADEAARLLADLHASAVGVERARPLHRLVRSAARKARDRKDDPTAAEFTATLVALDEAMGRQPDEGRAVLTHGDFSPRNVLRTPTGLALIDFDRLQLAAPARDVAYWGSWLWTTNVLAGRPVDESWALSEPFTAAYGRYAPGAVPEARVLAFHRALALVRIAHGWSALASDSGAVRTILAEARTQLLLA
ncbi:hypothetical protein GCM10009867_31540 [Pedococcus aerophilus]|uniref:Aminoglycoside phosphotransferase domain-containing protein n=1 Tax=Pedococcus aerophilus TaxID=436356 RepID=A0ABP6HBG1_9MICO